MNVFDFSFFKKYHKVAILSTSNGLYSRLDRLGLIYYSVDALRRSIIEQAPDTVVDMLDYKPSDELHLVNINSIDKLSYDAAVVMNHTAAFFAGTLPKSFRNALMFLNGYDGDVWWCYDTPAYFPQKKHTDIIRQYGKYTYKKYNKELSLMLNDQCFIESLDRIDEKMNVISDICIEDIPEGLVNASDYSKRMYNKIKSTFYVKSNLAKHIGTLYKSKDVFSEKHFDVCLAFNYDNYRLSLAKHLINHKGLNVVAIRHSPGNDIQCSLSVVPRIHNIERYYEYLETNCYSSLIVTTRNHLSCLKSERFYGVFNSYTAGFIPIECDKDMSWIRDPELKKFSYVSSAEELYDKAMQLHDKDFFDHIINLQRKEIS